MDLQPEKVIQLSNHAHLELVLYEFGETMSKFILCWPEDDIINIDLSNYQLAIFHFDEESFISFPSCEPMWHQVLCEPIIPSSRGLLEGLLDVQHMIRKVWINESFWLSHIDIFFNEPIQESGLDIHLVKRELQMAR